MAKNQSWRTETGQIRVFGVRTWLAMAMRHKSTLAIWEAFL